MKLRIMNMIVKFISGDERFMLIGLGSRALQTGLLVTDASS